LGNFQGREGKMHLKSRQLEFGRLAFFCSSDERPYKVTLLFEYSPDGKNHNWVYSAVESVFGESVNWVGSLKCVITTEIDTPLRNPRGFLDARARDLILSSREKRYEDRYGEFEEEPEFYEESELYEESPREVNLGDSPGGFRIYE
jgi:hypothetical protein